MIDYAAFHEEVVKIAQEAEAPKKKPFITKERLKRLAIVLPVAAAGAGLGHGVGKLIRNQVLSDKARRFLQESAKTRPWVAKAGKALPAVAGGLAAGAGMLQALKDKKVREHLEGKADEGKRPQ